MSNTKFTPGRWHVDGHNLHAVIAETVHAGNTRDWSFYQHVCTCDYGYAEPEKWSELNQANAKLIAAAPELLEALKAWKEANVLGDAQMLSDARIKRDLAIQKATL